ncbi:MAG: hypothetical protein Q4E82_01950 [Peptococcaceae bacterium]|nr:hypothetical protein [Peptococcaceae bacterium]
MLLNTLSIIESTIDLQFNNKVNTAAFLEFFRNYKKDMWIYPGVLKRKFLLSLTEVYEFLSALEKQGVVQSYYELYCSNCQKSMGIVRLFNELPTTFECELCHSELNTLENAYLIYKVIRDD